MTKPNPVPPEPLTETALDAVAGGAGVVHELAHIVQQRAAAQYNPKELTIDQSVPWQRQGS